MLPFSLPTEIASLRLIFRPLKQSDANPLFANYTTDPEVARYLPWRCHRSLSETEAMIDYASHMSDSGMAYLLAVTTIFNREAPVGLVNIAASDHGVSVGFGLSRNAWGNGYGAELATTAVQWVLCQAAVWRAWSYCDIENTTSAAVLKRAGMVFEGTARRFAIHPNVAAEPRDCHLFAAIKI